MLYEYAKIWKSKCSVLSRVFHSLFVQITTWTNDFSASSVCLFVCGMVVFLVFDILNEMVFFKAFLITRFSRLVNLFRKY